MCFQLENESRLVGGRGRRWRSASGQPAKKTSLQDAKPSTFSRRQAVTSSKKLNHRRPGRFGGGGGALLPAGPVKTEDDASEVAFGAHLLASRASNDQRASAPDDDWPAEGLQNSRHIEAHRKTSFISTGDNDYQRADITERWQALKHQRPPPPTGEPVKLRLIP